MTRSTSSIPTTETSSRDVTRVAATILGVEVVGGLGFLYLAQQFEGFGFGPEQTEPDQLLVAVAVVLAIVWLAGIRTLTDGFQVDERRRAAQHAVLAIIVAAHAVGVVWAFLHL